MQHKFQAQNTFFRKALEFSSYSNAYTSELVYSPSRTMVTASSRRLLTAGLRFQSKFISHGIYVGHSDTKKRLSPRTLVLPWH